ncbi:MAG: hypothetical protein V4739_14720 [Pseudomonadota bacterium]
MRPTPSTHPTRLPLVAGHAHRLQAARGLRLLNLGAAVLIETGDMTGVVRLEEGDSLAVEQPTWLTLTACGDAELICLPPAIRRSWRQVWPWMARATGSQARHGR